MTEREDLERIWNLHDGQYGSADEWRKAMKEAILDWHSRHKSILNGEKVKWCDRMDEVTNIKLIYQDDLQSKANISYSVSYIKYCLICGKERPKDD